MNIQKLREQIVALQDATMDENRNFLSDYDEGKYDALTAIDNLLDSLQEEPTKKNYRERYKRIAESEAFKKTHEGISIGEVIPVDGAIPKVFEDMLNAKTAVESLGISSEEYDRIVDECIFGEEPVNDDLEVELNKYIKDHFTIDKEQLDRFGIDERDYMYSMDRSDMLAMVGHFTNWQKTKEGSVSEDLEEASEQLAENARKHKAEISSPFFSPTDYKQGVIDGAKWQKNHLWKPADGNDLPEIDREIIALEGIVDQTATDSICGYKVVFAHRPASEGYDGRSLTTGEVEHYTPKTYGKGGWNIPNIVYWLDVELPKE